MRDTSVSWAEGMNEHTGFPHPELRYSLLISPATSLSDTVNSFLSKWVWTKNTTGTKKVPCWENTSLEKLVCRSTHQGTQRTLHLWSDLMLATELLRIFHMILVWGGMKTASVRVSWSLDSHSESSWDKATCDRVGVPEKRPWENTLWSDESEALTM